MPKRDLNSELLSEGCRSYHKALFALMQFRRQVQEVIRAAIDDHIDELASAMRLSKSDIQGGLASYADPANYVQNWDGSEADVGLKYPSADWDARWGIYFYVCVGDSEPSCAVALCWFREPGSLIGKLASSAEGIETSKSSAWISEPIRQDTDDGLSGAVDRLLVRWTELWHKAGGIQQFLPYEKARPSNAGT